MKARADIHPNQVALVAAIKRDPLSPFLLCGRNGVGKTRMGYALYRNAATMGRRAVAITVRALLDQYRKCEFPERDDSGMAKFFRAAVTADDLRIVSGPKWTLFLEEMDKASASEYGAQELFELLNAARDYGHQLVVTTNLNVDELSAHWSKMSRTYGPSIIERLRDCALVELF
jgi:DNA replication protein DnaC